MIIGITGGIGSGKSAVTRHLEEKGITIVDADQAARIIVEPGSTVLEELKTRYGSEVLLKDGNLNRPWLRERIFSDADERQWVESVMHPRIGEEILRQLQAADSPYTVLVSPLLLETSQHKMVDRVLVVDVPESIQVVRTASRDQVPESQVQAIIAIQTNRENKRDQADDIVDNSSDLKALHQQVDRLHAKYLKLSKS